MAESEPEDTVGVPFHDTRDGSVTTRVVPAWFPHAYMHREPREWALTYPPKGKHLVEVYYVRCVRTWPAEQCTPIQVYYLLREVGS